MTSLELSSDWIARENDFPREFQLFKVYRQDSSDGSGDGDPITIVRTLIVSEDMTWNISIHGHKLDPHISSATSKFPSTLKYDDFKELVSVIMKYYVCCGHPDKTFVEMAHKRKGTFMSIANKVVATLDSRFPVITGGTVSSYTIRHVKCELLTVGAGLRCKACTGYRDNLRAMYSNFSKHKPWSRAVNTRYLRTPQKAMKLRALKNALSNKKRQLQRLRAKLELVTNQHGVHVDKHLQGDFQAIIDDHSGEIAKLSVHSFQRIFWEQQVSILTVSVCHLF